MPPGVNKQSNLMNLLEIDSPSLCSVRGLHKPLHRPDKPLAMLHRKERSSLAMT